MKRKIERIIKFLLILMTIATVISIKFIIKSGVGNKFFKYYMIFYVLLLFSFFIYTIISTIVNFIKVTKTTKSLKWIGFKDLIISFFVTLIVVFLITIILKYLIKHDTNVIGSLWSCVGITFTTTIGELIYKVKNKKVKQI